jgi:hypothetical protein
MIDVCFESKAEIGRSSGTIRLLCPSILTWRTFNRADQYLHSNWLCRRSLDFAHIPMVYSGHLTIVPSDRDCIPAHFGDTAAVSRIAPPINATTLLEAFRFGGSH